TPENTKQVLYAGETTAITQNDTLELLRTLVRESVVYLKRWFNVNRLSLSRAQTEGIVFKLRDIDRNDGLDTDSVRLLGIRLDNTLTLESM
ncbi:hypothetical protein HHI36_007574, partial [Cryptolaemus montrouzieri]